MSGQKMYTLLAVLCFAVLAFFIVPKCCTEDHESKVQTTSDKSFVIDSLKRIETAKLKKHSDSLISIHKKKDSVAAVMYAKLEKEYKAQRVTIKHLTSIRVDSFNQVVIVPVIEYNALIESGNRCDSMNVLNNERIAEKDSINNQLSGQVKNDQEQNVTTQQALTDSRALTAEEKRKGEKAKKLNKILIKIVVVETAILAIIAIVL
jgi:hypothetical protein